MSLVKRGALLSNERLKQYKKPSTWILMGVIVLLTLLGLIFSQLFSSGMRGFNQSWQEQYNSNLESVMMQLKDGADDAGLKQMSEEIKYLLEENIPPTDWRTDAVLEYFSLKWGTQNQSDSKVYPGMPQQLPQTNLDESQVKARSEKLKAVLEKNDWKNYVQLRIDDLKSGITVSVNEQEKKIDLEMYDLYLKNNIVPVAVNQNKYYQSDFTNELGDQWKSQQVQSIRQSKLTLLWGVNEYNQMITHSKRQDIQRQIDVAMKRLSTDTPPVQSDSFLGLLEGSASALSLLSILLIVYAGTLFAAEYSSGTIKLLLITPHRRQKIFRAKSVLLLELGAIALGANFILSFLISGAFTGFGNIAAMQVLSLFGGIVQMPYLLYILLRYILLMLPVLTYGALAIMLSVVTRKSSVSIAVTLIIMFGSNILMEILSAFSGRFVIPGIKFLLFANTALEKYLPSAQNDLTNSYSAMINSMADGTMTLGFSIVILLLYFGCFLWIALDSFCRRDVK